MAIELVAAAKLNLTLEVLGRRPDGYHDVASVMQTIDLADGVRLEPAAAIEMEVSGEAMRSVPLEGPQNLAYRAAQALAATAGRSDLGVRIGLEKNVPAGMGLGGGSSDAAAVLRGLDRLWGLDLGIEALTRVAAELGSDVAFFLHGGTALAGGRGEVIEPLPDVEARSLTLFLSEMDLTDKTRLMYSTLLPGDFSEGQRTRVTAATVRRGLPLLETDLLNAFDRHVGEVAPQVAAAMALCREAQIGVLTAGSGLGFFSLTPVDELPALLTRELERDWGVKALGCQTLSRAAALAVREV